MKLFRSLSGVAKTILLLLPDTKSELWDMESDVVSVTGVVVV
ncbi:hypothetical protein [Nostoc sphaeroides]|uniref:Uncharacterized protein n=1 Tax=Nostoc sphaeroides CCNUC1 TaxID=2653204 RepID=A0A5P8WAA0_9NOSO|nr:hypothetical protein [Nostoc sphaeroides]QFS49715.1 hypothetical protein GXM_07209 [Nostoc sphaeroides CCNUC1]